MDERSGASISTVIIQTQRMGEMASFYGRGLELGEATATGDDHLGFSLSNIYFGFDQVEDAPKPSGTISLWFEVNNLESTFQRFVSLGAGIKYPPSKKPWGGYLAALVDTDGNLFGLSQRE